MTETPGDSDSPRADSHTTGQEVAVTINLDRVDSDRQVHDALALLIYQYDILSDLIAGVVALLPDTSTWRLTVTGDIVGTVNELAPNTDGSSYTTERGAGHVGAVTLPQEDGTYDIVITADALINPPGDFDDIDGLVANARASAQHLGRHEAGHVLLALRGKDDRSYRQVAAGGLSLTAVGWSDVVAAYMDDFRIERHTRRHAPSASSHTEALETALEHLVVELRESKRICGEDLQGAIVRSDTAVAGFIRMLAYLAAELGLDENGCPVPPPVDTDMWEFHVGATWEEWSKGFHRLAPVDEEMTTDEIVAVHHDLCETAARWVLHAGYKRGVAEDGRGYAFWANEQYSELHESNPQ